MVLILAGCGAENGKYDIKSLSLKPSGVSLNPQGSQKFTCKAQFGDGSSRDFNPKWAVSNSSIGSIDQLGNFTAASAASADGYVLASYGSLTASAEVKISQSSSQTLESPQSITFSSVAPYTLKLAWTDCSADGYLISYGTDSNADTVTHETTTNSADITGLKSNAIYYFKVKSYKTTSGLRVYSGFSSVFSVITADFPIKFSVSGNKILDDNGSEFVFRGVNILDPAWMDLVYNNVNDQYFQALKSWNVKIIRIPIHPAAYKYYGKAGYFNLLDKVLALAASSEIYAILDYHSIGFPPDGTYDNLNPGGLPWTESIYAYTDQEMKSFWQETADHFKNDDRVVFFEIFNEPTARVGATDSQSWAALKTKAEELIDIIRNYDSDSKIIVGGINYSYDLSCALADPINRSNIIYGTHPYPNQTKSYDDAFGNLSANYPVFATEFGFDPSAANGVHYKADSSYGTALISYLESKKISWTAWNFSISWYPALILDWNYTPSTSGTLFRNYLTTLNQ